MPDAPAATAPAGPASAPAPAAAPRTAALLQTALALQGTPYRDGGSTPAGFDCSGFTQWVFGRHGVTLPREVRDQYLRGAGISRRELQPGDLVFFSTVAPGASHVGIMIDAERFVHAPSSRGVVRVERLTLPYWDRRFVGVRRLRTD